MVIESTINISISNKKLLKRYANKFEISVSQLIVFLLNQYLCKQKGRYKTFSRIKYQKLKVGEEWTRVHVWFSADFYEKCLDLRNFHKFSLSAILSQAIDLYLDSITPVKYDNYNKCYIFFSAISDECSMFIKTWEYPGNKKVMQLLNLFENT
mgnify:CR=1 FL=1